MSNPDHVDRLNEGVDVWNEWRKENPEIKPDLSREELRNKDLISVNFSNTNLEWANLHSAQLSLANLRFAKLNNAVLAAAQLNHANIGRAELQYVMLNDANMHQAHLNGSDMLGAQCSRVHLRLAELEQTILSGANLARSNMEEVQANAVNLEGANLAGVNLIGAHLADANLCGANLSEAILVGTDLSGANLQSARVYGASAWDLNVNGTIQEELIITPEEEPIITVDNLEVAQFVYLLLKHEKLRDTINAVSENGVLLLGRFGEGGLDLLRAVALKLRELGYLPIIFDFERPNDRNYTETVLTLVGLSRFVIADISGPSVPQELYASVSHFKVPFVPIIEIDRRTYSTFTELLENEWVLGPVVEFDNQESLLEMLPEMVVNPAEERIEERRRLLGELLD